MWKLTSITINNAVNSGKGKDSKLGKALHPPLSVLNSVHTYCQALVTGYITRDKTSTQQIGCFRKSLRRWNTAKLWWKVPEEPCQNDQSGRASLEDYEKGLDTEDLENVHSRRGEMGSLKAWMSQGKLLFLVESEKRWLCL